MKENKNILVAKKMALRFLLASLTCTNLMGCSSEKDEILEIPEIVGEPFLNEEEEINDVSLNDLVEESKFIEISSIVANDNVNIRKSPVEGELLGKLVKGHTLELLGEEENGWYKVQYYEHIGYVSNEFASKTTTYQVRGDIKKVCYAIEDVLLTIPEELRKEGEVEEVLLPKLECIEIYEETEDAYLVQTNDYIGYVSKTNLEELAGTFVTVDISNQELKLYKENEVILETPVVTGKPTKSRRSDEGLFEIYKYKYNDYLRGKNENGSTYKSYVDIMMYYNNGEGLHDAEFHHCENGKDNDHGWRDYASFGGDTYLTNGSHGCINMPHDAVFEVAEYVSEGTLVLVHK